MSDFDEKEVEKLLPQNFDTIARETFAKYDLDKNGSLDLNELLTLLKELGKDLFLDDNVTIDDATEGMESLDMNQNNLLEYEEVRKLLVTLFIINKSKG